MKAWLKALAWVAGALGAVLLAGLLVLNALASEPAVTTWLTREVLTAVRRSVPAVIEVDAVAVRPWGLELELRGVRLSSPKRPGHTLISLRRAGLALDLFALLRRQVRVTGIHLEQLEATATHLGKNRYDLEELLPPPGPKRQEEATTAPWVSVDDFSLKGGRLAWLDPIGKQNAWLEGPEIATNFELRSLDAEGRLGLQTATYRQGAKRVVAGPLALRFRLSGGDRLDLSGLRLESHGARVAVDGHLSGLKTGQLAADARFRLGGPLAPWSPWAGRPLAGAIEAEGRVAGPLKDPVVELSAQGRGLRAEGVSVPRLQVAGRLDAQWLELKRFEASLLGGWAEADGRLPRALLDGKPAPAPYAFRLEAQQLDVGAALRLAPPSAQVKGLSGRLGFRAEAEGRNLKPEGASATASLRFQGTVPAGGKHPQPARLEAEARVAQGLAQLTRAEAWVAGLRATATAKAWPFAKPLRYEAEARVPKGPLAPLLALAEQKLDLRGTASAVARVRGVAERWQAEAEVASEAIVGPGLSEAKRPFPVALKAKAQVGQDLVVRLQQAEAKAFGGVARASGVVKAGGKVPDWDLAIALRDLQLAPANAAFAVAKGPLVGSVSADARLKGYQLALREARLKALGGQAIASGQVGLKAASYRLRVDAEGFQLAQANRAFQLSATPLDGTAGAHLNVSGQKAQAQVAGRVAVQGGAYVPNELGGPAKRVPIRLAAQLQATPKRAVVQALDATAASARLQAQGVVALDGPSDLRFQAQVPDLAPVAALAGTKASGGNLRLTGSLKGPRSAVAIAVQAAMGPAQLASTKLEAAELRVQGQYGQALAVAGGIQVQGMEVSSQPVARVSLPFSYQAPATALGKGRLKLPAIALQLVEGGVQGQAEVDLAQRSYLAKLEGQKLTLKDLATAEAEGLPTDTPIRFRFEGQGSLADPGGKLQVALPPIAYRGAQLGASELEAVVARQKVELKAKLLGDQLLAKGAFPLTQAPGQLSLRFAKLQLAPLAAMAPAAARESLEMPVEGEIDGEILVKGPLMTPAKLGAEVRLDTFKLAYRDLQLGNQDPLKLAYREGWVKLEAFHLVGTGTDLKAEGTAALRGPLSLDLNDTLNLAILEKLAPRALADSAGSLTLKASVRGTPGKPDLQGELRLSDGAFAARAMPQALRDMELSLRLASDRVLLEQFSTTVGHSGRVEATGGARLGVDGSPQAVELNARAREVVVRIPDASVTLNGDLAFSGTPKSSRLDGQVTVLEGRYTKDIPLVGRSSNRVTSVPVPEDPFEGLPFLDDLNLRLAVEIPDQVTIKNNLADMQLRGDVVVAGTSERPVLMGRVESVEGEVTFQDRTYVLEEATVDFIDPNRIVPFVNVQASSNIKGYELRLAANGTPEALKLNLSSTPFLPEADLVVLMATGQTPSELSRNAGDVNAAAGAAGNFLLSQVTQKVTSGIAGGGVVDLLQIQPGSIDPAQPSAGSLTVGKRLSEQLTITYTQDLSADPTRSGNKVIFDYLLTDSIVLKLENNLGGGFNASARYRIPVR